ncbi:MAG: hypothetical protein A2Z47_04990 [Thermodesulfovibrio sp. RBG_19FT_COMBO_42_12]|nr:MAG: hypothetical protein A2Z47_04990 [Thermodesulfovibrio sp. RBG_19FT_COMBO_42_12]
MVDKALLLRKISELETYQKQIREFSDITLQNYKEDWKTQRVVERTLQMMIETCADIANHIISDAGMRVPTGYSDTFKVLFENNFIDRELFPIMEKMAKFRNIIIHQYEEVDAEIVIAILKKHLPDFERYKEAVLAYLKTSP